jgi:phosphodiesterase/alkaline phosphatase D-like protein
MLLARTVRRDLPQAVIVHEQKGLQSVVFSTPDSHQTWAQETYPNLASFGVDDFQSVLTASPRANAGQAGDFCHAI